MASVREAILLMLLGATLTLLVGPGIYVFTTKTRYNMLERYRSGAHGERKKGLNATCAVEGEGQCKANTDLPQSSSGDIIHQDAEVLHDRKYIKETVFGGLDGLLTMVALLLGGIGCDLSTRHIFSLSISNLVADAFAKGFAEYIGGAAEKEFADYQQEEEYREVRELPNEEIREMVQTYQKRGLSQDDALKVAGIFSRYEDYWVRHMLWEELQIQSPESMNNPIWSGLIIFMSFIGFGMVPLLGVAFPLVLERRFGAEWYRPEYSAVIALAISACILFIMGGVFAVYSGSESMLRSSLLMLLNGCAASGISFAMSQAIFSLGPPGPGGSTPSTPRLRTASGEPSGSDASASTSPTSPASQRSAWPFFRRRFLRLLCFLWVLVSAIVLIRELVRSMVWETLRVLGYGTLTCVVTGLGVIPLVFVPHDGVDERWLAYANTIAAGTMLAASFGMLQEAHEVSGPYDWQVLLGLVVGVVFIKGSQIWLGDDEEEGIEGLWGAVMEKKHFKRAVLIFTVMFCHSAAEGVAVGVAFDQHCEAHFGLYVSMLLAIQNIPEGTAVGIVLVPRGVNVPLAAVIATLTSVPQPLMAVAAFRFVETFQSLLPIGLSFAAGAMVYVSGADLLHEASEHLGKGSISIGTSLSFCLMYALQYVLQGWSVR